MKRILFTIVIAIIAITNITAQEQQKREKRKKFSPKEFQARQKEFITKEAQLTVEEAEKFFPIFFELQKEKWLINEETRKKVGFKRGEQFSDEQCLQFVNELANAKIRTAELEKAYIDKYLQVIPACKILRVQHAEEHFQRHMLKNMWERKNKKRNPKEKK